MPDPPARKTSVEEQIIKAGHGIAIMPLIFHGMFTVKR